MRILIIEDDMFVCDFLKKALTAEYYVVDACRDGESGSYACRTNQYDLVILDLILPKKSGLEVCKEIRLANINCPILVISVKNTLASKLDLLRAGADDYMSKPFSFEEMHERIRAIARRPRAIVQSILSIGNVVLDESSQIVKKSGKEIYLTRKEYCLLVYLLKNKGRVVSRGMIMEHVWNNDSDPFSNTIEAHILNLRRKIDNGEYKMIYNVPGRGYKIVEPAVPQSSAQ
jgi:DNA-binding response OmpR family regulator